MSRLAGRLAAVLVLVGIRSSFGWTAEAESPNDRLRESLVREIARRTGRPEAAAPLAELVRLHDQLAPGRLRDDLRAIERAHDPLVSALAGYALSLEEDRLGENEAAQSRRRALGFIDSFWVLGPFEAQGRGALEIALPPERELPDPRGTGRYAGKITEIGWRRIDQQAAVQGAFHLDAVLRPDRESAAYLLTYVNSERDGWGALRLGSPGPVKAWLNGTSVLSREAVRGAFPDQDAAAVWLHRGTNVLVIKTVVLDGAWRIFARLTDADGKPLSGVNAQLEPGATPSAKPADRRRPNVLSLAEILRRRAEKAKEDDAAARWLDYAQLLAWIHSEDADGKFIEAAARKARATSDPAVSQEALWLEGQVAKEADERRAALDVLVSRKLEPWREAAVRSRLGDLAQQQHRSAAALIHWRRAIELDPQCVPAQLALATEEMGAGLYSSALQRLAGLPGWNRQVSLTRARVLRILGRLQEAESELQSLRTTHGNDVEILRDLAQAARSRGDLAQAARLDAEAAHWRPDLEFLTLDEARMLEGRGNGRAAETVLRQLTERLPDEARAHEELGRFLARAGRSSDAVVALRRALELRPQQPTLRRYTEWLAGQGSRNSTQDLAREYAADAEAVSREALLGAAPKDDDSAVVLLERQVTRVHLNGLAEKFVQRIVHVRTERAARDNQETAIRYVPGQQEVEIRQARILRRSPGDTVEISEATGRDDRDLSEPWYGLYYDARAQVVIFDGVRAGDVVEIQYTVADVAHQNDMTDYFGELEVIADVLPTRRWDYTLIGPESRSFNFNQPRLPGLQHDVNKRGGQVIHHFTAENVPRVDIEPSMPGFTEVAPYLHVSTYRSWQDVGRWYWKLVADQLQGDANLTRAARDATARLRTNEEKVRALHRLVIEGTRYVGLEFGIHGYKPYKVTQILQRRFGDCKDKASLLVALLREVGIAADLVLLRTRRSGHVDPEPASLAIFDHAIAYVPSMDIYLDGTAEFAGMAELPGQDQGVMALHVSANGVRLTDTPVLPADRNRAQRTWNVQLDRDGNGRIDEDLVITGQAAHEWRSHYQTPGERQERYGRAWEGRLAGAKLESVAIDVEDRNRPVSVHARGFVPQLGERRAGGELRLPTSSRDADLTRTYARLGARHWPLALGFPWQHAEDLTYELPEGFRLVRAPQSRRVASPFGTFDFQVHPEGNRLSIHSSLSVDQNRISPADYDAFRTFLREVDGLLAERIVIGEGTP
jgi:tetratricopeptide (TPR) repeat protein